MAKNHENNYEDKGRLGKKVNERYPNGDIPDCSSEGHKQGDTPLQVRECPLATQTGRGMPLYNTDSEQTPGLITCCRTWWGKKAKLY